MTLGELVQSTLARLTKIIIIKGRTLWFDFLVIFDFVEKNLSREPHEMIWRKTWSNVPPSYLQLVFIFWTSCTAWDSEIESLTSLIKLHQNERRSASCGQIGAATQPPVLAPSPVHQLWKSFVLHERSKLDELARAVMIGRVLIPVSYYFLISVFFFVSLELCTTLNAHSSLAYSQHQHQATSWWHDDAFVRCSHAQQ